MRKKKYFIQNFILLISKSVGVAGLYCCLDDTERRLVWLLALKLKTLLQKETDLCMEIIKKKTFIKKPI